MEKIKEYRNTLFSVETLKKAILEFDSLGKPETIRMAKALDFAKKNQTDEEIFSRRISREMSIRRLDETWKYDSEDEFFGDYRKYAPGTTASYFHYKRSLIFDWFEVESVSGMDSRVSVRFHLDNGSRSAIERVFDVFETDAEKSKLPYELIVKPKIFIGHGRSSLWRDLVNDKHSYEVVAYEVGSRTGHAIRDILEDMLATSSFAILVMTAEDQTADGQFRARQNVVHETGLFQGRLGFNRAIVLLEDGVEEFSNIHGIEQIRFSKGNIRETFGEVLAAIKREFY
ncbi:MAG: nucleotide-binding protein [Thermoplasmata archaeon]|nr:nucleotide-binding protein [Thermoplasmata archaeon]